MLTVFSGVYINLQLRFSLCYFNSVLSVVESPETLCTENWMKVKKNVT